MIFQHYPPYKCMGMQIWPCLKIKGQPRVIILTNLVDLDSMMLYNQDFSLEAFLVLEKKNFTSFYHMGMVAILINGPWTFEQIFNSPLSEGSTWRK